MLTPKRQQFVIAQAVWTLGILTTLEALDFLDPSLFFIMSFLGFLTILEATGPYYLRLPWRKRLLPFVGTGVLVFGAIVLNDFLSLL